MEVQTQQGGDSVDDPSHTQLAKDPPDHHLNALAAELAVKAVRDFSGQMLKCWSGVLPVQDLILHMRTTYFKHPSNTVWMDEHVEQWAIRHSKEVQRAQSATPHEHIEQKLDDYFQNSLPAEIKAIKGILGL